SGIPKPEGMTSFLFTGREYDYDVGVYHFRSRAYLPSIGRFLQIDPILLDANDVNMYRYVRNSPLIYNDPFGLCSSLYNGAATPGLMAEISSALGGSVTAGSSSTAAAGSGAVAAAAVS